MSIEYRAVVFVGLPYEDLEDWVETLEENGDDWENHLDGVFTCYDSGNNFLGLTIDSSPDYGATEVDYGSFCVKVQKALEEFIDITGKEGKLYLSTLGW